MFTAGWLSCKHGGGEEQLVVRSRFLFFKEHGWYKIVCVCVVLVFLLVNLCFVILYSSAVKTYMFVEHVLEWMQVFGCLSCFGDVSWVDI